MTTNAPTYTVPASIRSDDGKARGTFDAAPWLEAATDGRIRVLAHNGWQKCTAADDVAFGSESADGVQAVFGYIQQIQPFGPDGSFIGFEVIVNAREAMAWLRLNRWSLYLELYHLSEEAKALKSRKPMRPELVRALAAMDAQE